MTRQGWEWGGRARGLRLAACDSLVERRLRLRREAEVNEVRKRGRAFADGPLVARILPNTLDPPQNRYAVIAGKRVGKAVKRNRAKRLVREALRALHPRLKPGHDIVVIVRGGLEEMPGLAVALSTLERIFARARLFQPAPEHPKPDAGGDTDLRQLPETAAER